MCALLASSHIASKWFALCNADAIPIFFFFFLLVGKLALEETYSIYRAIQFIRMVYSQFCIINISVKYNKVSNELT